MKHFILTLVLFSSTGAYGDAIKVESLGTEVRSYTCGYYCSYRHAFLPPEQELKYSVLQNSKIRVYDYLVMENLFFFDGNHKVKFAGLEYKFGFDIPMTKRSSFEFGKFHHSSHAVDQRVRDGEFPLKDALYFKFNWIGK